MKIIRDLATIALLFVIAAAYAEVPDAPTPVPAYLQLINGGMTMGDDERTTLCVQLVTDIHRDTIERASMMVNIAQNRGAIMSDGYVEEDVFTKFNALTNTLNAENGVYTEHCQTAQGGL